VRGQSNWSGFYAGPTSVVSYLTSVGLLCVAIPQNDADTSMTAFSWNISQDIQDDSGAPGHVTMIPKCIRNRDVRPAQDSDYDLREGLPHTSVIDRLCRLLLRAL
jgi:hypothetical protein